eukprot:scpid34746/ scgid14238/ 
MPCTFLVRKQCCSDLGETVEELQPSMTSLGCDMASKASKAGCKGSFHRRSNLLQVYCNKCAVCCTSEDFVLYPRQSARVLKGQSAVICNLPAFHETGTHCYGAWWDVVKRRSRKTACLIWCCYPFMQVSCPVFFMSASDRTSRCQ